ncbi:MAG: hypothetical protein WCD79_15525 [Chthoniobacteraceae bacterium]
MSPNTQRCSPRVSFDIVQTVRLPLPSPYVGSISLTSDEQYIFGIGSIIGASGNPPGPKSPQEIAKQILRLLRRDQALACLSDDCWLPIRTQIEILGQSSSQ